MKRATGMELEIGAEAFDLDLTLSPSFVSSLYHRTGPKRWAKIAGLLGGDLELEQRGEILKVKSSSCIGEEELLRIALHETGLWHGPYEEGLRSLPRSVKPILESLGEAYAGVRLPIAPLDFDLMFIAVALSKRADYEGRVLVWCRAIWERYGGDIRRISSAPLNELRRISPSHQVLSLGRTLRSFLGLGGRLPRGIVERFGAPEGAIGEYLLRLPPELARLALISGCWGIGPKTADSIMLSTFKAPHLIPCDSHLRSVALRLGLADEGLRMPRADLCSKFLCDRGPQGPYGIDPCPRFASCLRGGLAWLGDLGGWFQTLAYIHGRAYCRTLRPKCRGCPIEEVCPTSALRKSS
ncbi:MAG: hypothetical protein QXV89_05590 [Candidatus Bathyarchaeia archaeon]